MKDTKNQVTPVQSTKALQKAGNKGKNRKSRTPAEKRAHAEEKIARAVANHLILWNQWVAKYSSEAIAIAEAVSIINRWIKRLPKYKNRSKVGNKIVDWGYGLKDYWLKKNVESLISAEISVDKEDEYFDSEGFYWAKASGGWVDPDEYWVSKRYTLYAYELSVEGRLYRFHSEKKLDTQIAYNKNPNSEGRANPLTNADVEKFEEKDFGLIDLLRILSAGLNVNQKDYNFWTSPKLSKSGKFFQPLKKTSAMKQLSLEIY